MAENKEKLFSDFPPVSTDAWMEKVTADLKGADFEKKLVWRTNEGFNVRPFYRREDLEGLRQTDALPGEFPYLRGNRKDDNSWLVRQDIRVEDPAEANAKALDILNRGVDALGFSVKAKQLDETYLETLLKDIKADCVELNFSTCQGHVVELVQLLVAYFKKQGYDLSKLRGSIAYDPLGKMLSKGKERTAIAETGKKLIEASAELCGYQVLGVDASILCDAGAYIYQELGYALAWGNEYLHALTEAGVPAPQVAKNIKFNLGVSSNYFMEIAKFRAARMLWADIVEQYLGPDDCKCAAKMHIHAITSRFNLTLFDSYVNLLRTQTEAMSAALAGVESMTVLPFDAVYAEPDPAGGSYYIENLTASIAAQAWKLFLAVEDEGGFYASVKAGKVQEAVNASNSARHEAVARRKEILLGTNQYPNFTERAEGKQPLEGHCCCGGGHEHTCEKDCASLDASRAASEFEALRLETELSGKRPKAFMLTIAPSSRATSWPVPDTRSSTTWASLPSRKASTPLWSPRQTSWCSAPATMNMPSTPSPPTRRWPGAPCSSWPVLPPAWTS